MAWKQKKLRILSFKLHQSFQLLHPRKISSTEKHRDACLNFADKHLDLLQTKLSDQTKQKQTPGNYAANPYMNSNLMWSDLKSV